MRKMSVEMRKGTLVEAPLAHDPFYFLVFDPTLYPLQWKENGVFDSCKPSEQVGFDCLVKPWDYIDIVPEGEDKWMVIPKIDFLLRKKLMRSSFDKFYSLVVKQAAGYIDVYAMDDQEITTTPDTPRFYKMYFYDGVTKKVEKIDQFWRSVEGPIFRRSLGIVLFPLPNYYGGLRLLLANKDEVESDTESFFKVLLEQSKWA